MKPFRLFLPGQNPWGNGLRLALLNAVLAAFSVLSFLGVLSIISWINQLQYARGAGPSSELPFPYPVLMLLYAILFIIAWIWFGRRLTGTRRERIIATLVGSVPLFGLSILGYVSVIAAFVLNGINSDPMSGAGTFVFGGISTLILFAGIACAGLILLVSRTASQGTLVA